MNPPTRTEQTFTKGQSVTDAAARYRYRVETCHRDGDYTVRAMFALDERGNDQPGCFGYHYRVKASFLVPMPERRRTAEQVSA